MKAAFDIWHSHSHPAVDKIVKQMLQILKTWVLENNIAETMSDLEIVCSEITTLNKQSRVYEGEVSRE